MAESGKNLPQPGEVHGRNPEEIRHARMQVHEYTHGSKAEAASRYFVRFDRCHSVQTDYWIVDVPDEHQTRHLFCSEHLESVSGGAQTCSFSGCKTCDEIGQEALLIGKALPDVDSV